MKRKEIFISNAILFVAGLFFAVITFNIFSNVDFGSFVKDEVIKNVKKEEAPKLTTYTCSKQKPLEIKTYDEQHLVKLEQYQEYCGSFATDTWMIFTSFPYDTSSAQELVTELSTQLTQFHENKVTPIVIAEPYIGEVEMQYRDFMNGMYDQALDTYFRLFKEAGMTDEMMGIWVPFPESNTPNWANKDTQPGDFAFVVNKYLSVYKKYFPAAKASILLNAVTYAPDDIDWENGNYESLNPYIGELNTKLVDSFGIQGFPWKSNALQRTREIFDPMEFLQPDIAIAAAQTLKTRDIWFNTGTFSAKYTNDPEKEVRVSVVQRKSILEGIIQVAQYVEEYQLNNYRVRINLFSQDKSQYNEATDWSYFQDEESKEILREFLWNAEQAEIPVSIFDR